jgi:hypothetical protein
VYCRRLAGHEAVNCLAPACGLLQPGIKVVSASLGRNGNPSSTEVALINNLANRGILFVVAAGELALVWQLAAWAPPGHLWIVCRECSKYAWLTKPAQC